MVIQITQQGRSTAQKQAMHAAMSERPAALGTAPTDLLITTSENTKADWSFGQGRAQFLTGEL